MPDVEEDKPEPDLDELLELFREPEEEPRRKKGSGAVWLMAALVLSLVGGWMAAVVANRPAAKHSDLGPPVLPTKVRDRKPRGANGEPLGVVEDYITRCEKGMTAQQVRWIIEDFQKAGLDQELGIATAEDFIRQRKAQQAWYLNLLVDGLRLDLEQRREAKEKLAVLFDEAVSGFPSQLSEQGEAEGRPLSALKVAGPDKFINADQWLTDERYAPWELSELTDEQKRLTWLAYVEWVRDPESSAEEKERAWMDSSMCNYLNPNNPAAFIGDFGTGEAPGDIYGASAILPFVPGQQFGKGDVAGPLEVQAMGCHPAQLKTSLLVSPRIAARLLKALDADKK